MENSGLYMHIPFCRSKCNYCDFYSITSTRLIPRYLEALKTEIEFYRGRFGSFDSLYMGGGTPTLLDLGEIKKILDRLYAHLVFSTDVEKTIEANPCDMTPEKIAGLKALGFNRINLGVQSFNDRDLMFLGRAHRARDAEKALEGLRSAGFSNIGMDLIYGLGDQDIRGWIETMEKAVSYAPEHLSCYQLGIEKRTVLGRMREKGLINAPDEERERAFFIATSEFLGDKGYIHYEISNFARAKAYYSRHNCKYWNRVPYLGLGPSAHSFDGDMRWWNYRSIRRYCDALKKRYAPVDDSERLSDEQKRIEIISLGLRTSEGFDIKGMEHDPGLHKKISELKESGYIDVRNNRMISTIEGFLVADRLPLYFLT
jgi:putative oxygen-independent coproporphyrinogen III oxidase